MQIRGYTPSDRAAIERITRKAWREVSMAAMREKRYGMMGGEPWDDQKANSVLARCAAHPEWAIVAEVDGLVVGYATYTIILAGDVGVVGDNAVDPAWQGKGIGTALISRVLELLVVAKVRLLEVSTLEHDTAARRVYERLGFREMARTVHYTLTPDEVSGGASWER